VKPPARFPLALAAWLAATAPAAALLAGPVSAAASGHAPQVTSVVLASRHRVFPDFLEVDSVRVKQEFPVGDTPFSAQVLEFVPDFAMDLKTHKVISRTPEPRNPAFRILVREKGVIQDTTWAFINMPPHFGRKSLLAFFIVRIDFKDRPSMWADDSLATRVPHPPAPPHSTAAHTDRPPSAQHDSTSTGARRP
jgi:hypothetical protein